MNADERFRALFDDHYRSILGYALRRSRDVADAADLASEVFATTWRRIHDVPPEPEAKLWIFGVARHVLQNQSRSNLRHTRLSERMGNVLRSQIPHDMTQNLVLKNAVLCALDKLNSEDKEIMQLTVWEELTPAEIAQLLDANSAHIRKRLFVVRKQLRQQLAETNTEHVINTGHVVVTNHPVDMEQKRRTR